MIQTARQGNIIASDLARTAQLKPIHHDNQALQAAYESLKSPDPLLLETITGSDLSDNAQYAPNVRFLNVTVPADSPISRYCIPIKLDGNEIALEVFWIQKWVCKWYRWMIKCPGCSYLHYYLGWYGGASVVCWKCAGEKPMRKVYIPKVLQPVKLACDVDKAQQERRRAGRMVRAAARRRFRLGENVEVG